MYNFDEFVERKNTGCLKYDFAVERGKPEGILPLWVADMDFKIPDEVISAIKDRAEHGVFGYSEAKKPYFEAVSQWLLNQHGWRVNEDWLVKTPGIVFALAMAVKAFTKEGDSVLIQQPVYYPFSEVITDNNRKLISNDLVYKNGKYEIDFDDFEKKITENNVKLFLLCSPHNPVGRVWRKEELIKIGDICLKNNVTVVADEIHSDFVWNDNKHVVFASLNERYADITITCTAPSKTFNIAGLQISNIFISNEKLKAAFKKQIAAAGYSQLNTFGLVACEASYRYGFQWYTEVKKYIYENILFVKDYLKNNIPKVKLIEPEGTYLLWLDFNEYGLTNDEIDDLIINKAGLWLDGGSIFGKPGNGMQRINAACQRNTLKEASERIKYAFEEK